MYILTYSVSNDISNIIDSVKLLWSYITGFITYMFSLPVYLTEWYSSLPDFIATTMFMMMMIITTIIIMKTIVLLKGVIS